MAAGEVWIGDEGEFLPGEGGQAWGGLPREAVGVPVPGGVWETCGCGTEGRGLVMGLGRWLGDPEGLFPPKLLYDL